MAYEDRYKEFEQYLTSGEPGVEERVRNWSVAVSPWNISNTCI